MDDQEAVAVVNHEFPIEKLKALVQQGQTTSFIFSIKNRVGGLARALRVFQVDFAELGFHFKIQFEFLRKMVSMLFILNLVVHVE